MNSISPPLEGRCERISKAPSSTSFYDAIKKRLCCQSLNRFFLAIQNCQEQGKKANEEKRKKRLIDLEWQKLSMERTQSLINQYTSQFRSQYASQRFSPPESVLQSLAISKAKSEYYNQVQTIAAADMGFIVNQGVNQGVNATVNSTVN